MEARQLLAMTAVLNPVSHVLTITGSSSNDNASVSYGDIATVTSGTAWTATPDTSTLRVSIKTDFGYEVDAQFSASAVKSIVYNGNGGTDYFTNATTIASSTTTTATGTVGGSLLVGDVKATDPALLGNVGTYVVGSTGQVSVDYLYDGAGYRGQLGMFSLSGMGNLVLGTSAYNEEAARRALSNSTLGHTVISVQTETAKYQANLSWEGNYHDGHGSYLGPKTFTMTPGDTFATILVPNGTLQQVFNNPSVGGNLQPLYSIPAANPYTVTPQLLGQQGDLDGHGSLFAYEDLRLDQGSDKDYNDVVFQVTGAKGMSPPVSDMVNPSKDFLTTPVFQQIEAYAVTKENTDLTQHASFRSGTFTVGSTGQVSIDYLFDGAGYNSEMAIFSLQGMQNLTPGSTAFIKEAARRALSDSVLGHVAISQSTEGARTSAAMSWEKDYNHGTYQGAKTYAMTAGDTFGVMLVPAGTVWELYNNAALTGKKTPLFSMPEANPGGYDQLAQFSTAGTTFGFEDMRRDGYSDQDYDDLMFRVGGATAAAPSINKLAAAGKNLLNTTAAAKILA